jgi:hypothetical protein
VEVEFLYVMNVTFSVIPVGEVNTSFLDEEIVPMIEGEVTFCGTVLVTVVVEIDVEIDVLVIVLTGAGEWRRKPIPAPTTSPTTSKTTANAVEPFFIGI